MQRYRLSHWQYIRQRSGEIDPAFAQPLRHSARPRQIALQRLMAMTEGNPAYLECKSATREAWAFVLPDLNGEPSNRCDAIHAIATDGDVQISLDTAGIDALCEHITLCSPVRCVIGLEGGLVTGVTANVDLEFVVLDYDVEGCDGDEVMTVPSLWGEDKVIDVYKRGFYDADVAPEPVQRLHAAIEAIMDAEA